MSDPTATPTPDELRAQLEAEQEKEAELQAQLAASSTAPARIPLEQHAEKKKTAAWLVATAKVHEGWAIGREVTEAEYDAAIDRAANIRIA